jgi:hypothetical protein
MPPPDLGIIEPGAVIVTPYTVKSMVSGLLSCSKTGYSKNVITLKVRIFLFQLKEKNTITSKNIRTIAMITIVLLVGFDTVNLKPRKLISNFS